MKKVSGQIDSFLTTMFSCWIFVGLYIAGWKCFLFLLLFISIYTISKVIAEKQADIFITSLSMAFLISCILFLVSYLGIYLVIEEPKEIVFSDVVKNFKHKYMSLLLGASIPLGLFVSFTCATLKDKTHK